MGSVSMNLTTTSSNDHGLYRRTSLSGTKVDAHTQCEYNTMDEMRKLGRPMRVHGGSGVRFAGVSKLCTQSSLTLPSPGQR